MCKKLNNKLGLKLHLYSYNINRSDSTRIIILDVDFPMMIPSAILIITYHFQSIRTTILAKCSSKTSLNLLKDYVADFIRTDVELFSLFKTKRPSPLINSTLEGIEKLPIGPTVEPKLGYIFKMKDYRETIFQCKTKESFSYLTSLNFHFNVCQATSF